MYSKELFIGPALTFIYVAIIYEQLESFNPLERGFIVRHFKWHPNVSTTRMNPIDAHISYIRHLTRRSVALNVLQNIHGFTKDQAQSKASDIASFIEQGLYFYDASKSATCRTKPVFQYYAYLNFAVAIILIYQPRDWEGYKKHGIFDLTKNSDQLSLSTPVIKTSAGALSLFNSILSCGSLPSKPMNLKQILTAIPMISAETKSILGFRAQSLSIFGRVYKVGNTSRVASTYRFTIRDENQKVENTAAAFPMKRLYGIMPALMSDYTMTEKDVGVRTFQSKKTWAQEKIASCALYHDEMSLKMLNYGGHGYSGGDINYAWYVYGDMPMLQSLTACMMLSFVLASLCRYRANVLRDIEDSRLFIVFETYIGESDGIVIPAFRNLMYAENNVVEYSALT